MCSKRVTETSDVAQEQSAGLSHKCPWTQTQLSKITKKKKKKNKGGKGSPKETIIKIFIKEDLTPYINFLFRYDLYLNNYISLDMFMLK